MAIKWLNNVKRTGITSDVPEEEVQQIMIVNSFCFIIAILCTFYGVGLAWISGEWIICWSALVFVAGFLSALFFNKYHLYSAAKFSLPFTISTLILYYGQMFGEATEVHLLCLFLSGVPLLIFNKKEQFLKCICIMMPIVCLVLLEVNHHYAIIPPLRLTNAVTNSFRWLIMGVIFLLNCIILSFYQQNINNLLQVLGIRNDSLVRSHEEVELQKSQLRSMNKELILTNIHLEAQVEERTEEIRKSKLLLEETLENLRNSYATLQAQENELKHQVIVLHDTRKNLAIAKDEADKANHAKSKFLREISHEIRNPLNIIIGFSDILIHQQSSQLLPVDAQEMIHHIDSSGRGLLEIINNVLELAKIEAGRKDDILNEPFNIRDWMHNLVAVAQSNAKTKDLHVNLILDHKLPERIVADRKHLTQVINNLVGNAIKFTPKGKNITVHCSEVDGNSWCIRISDEGIGIAEDRLPFIFQPFVQADNTVSHNYGGTGLGLTISKHLVELMGGAMEVTSEIGIGTCFTIVLPLVEAAMEEPRTEQQPKTWEKMPAGKRVLVMEDNLLNQKVMHKYCQGMGLDIEVAEDGEKGIEKALKNPPDLIFMDMHMPNLCGTAALLALRTYPNLQHIPVVAISADAFYEQQQEALRDGFNDYLVKPIEYSRLYDTLSKYLITANQTSVQVSSEE
ncbi:signal transduction histidine kinase [Chitinophaga skermanii]|uniref:histidine kinase n=1 Tax=Chitinophaga skermanii TaxID=331697 RepID=A0A327QK20_9BACT|nr:ATP-binding protein [Chitinophaga skermanii]RAJ04032.1 signal transduction histidine kinase [Chitinophaga skermanii]